MRLEIREQNGKKFDVYINDSFYCRCYLKDLLSIGVSEDSELSEDVIPLLNQRIFFPRAKKRALNLLDKKYYTRQAMQKKLRQDGYPEKVIEDTIEYLEELHFIADDRYAEDLAENLLKKYSVMETIHKMQLRGLTKDAIQKAISDAKQAYLEENGNDESVESQECIAIRNYLRKKGIQSERLESDKKKRIVVSLYRKGFSISDIQKVLGEAEDDGGGSSYEC